MNGRLIAAFVTMIGVMAATNSSSQSKEAAALLPHIDHLVYATPDLRVCVEHIENVLGVRATPGGQHPGEGTRNAVISLGPAVYLECLGPDPAQPKPDKPRWFGIDDLTTSRLVGWAAKGDDLAQLVSNAMRNGIKLGEVVSGSRQTPQGVRLTWQTTNQRTRLADGIVPFFIDWGQTPHPARTAAGGAMLLELRAEHPDAERVQKILSQLGLNLPVTKGTRPALVAIIASPRGRVELR
jgi:hypothetical protein